MKNGRSDFRWIFVSARKRSPSARHCTALSSASACGYSDGSSYELPAAQFARHIDHVLQFHGAFHLRVAGQNLLDQRGTGPRQAHNEDGVRRWAPKPRALREEFPRKQRLRTLHQGIDLIGIVVDAGAAAPVTLGVVFEAARIVLSVLERLAQGKIKMEPILIAEIGALQPRAHRLQFFGAESKGLEIGQAPVRFTEIRCDADAPAISADGLLLAPGRAQRVSIAHPDLGVLWVPRQYLDVGLDGLGVVTNSCQHHSQRIEIGRIARFVLEQAFQFLERILGPIAPVQG